MDLQKLQAMLIRHEGLKKFPYVDTTGNLTIGVGHNLTAKGLTDGQIRIILTDDITDAINFLNSHLPWVVFLDDVRQRVLADMAFNLMGKVLDFKNMLAAIQAKDWNRAADELLNSAFAHQTGQRAKDLSYMIRTGLNPQ